jgi:hypothetical protein
MNSSKPNNVKFLAAVVGGSAVVAMGALSMAFSQEQATTDLVAKSSSMTIGSTTTAAKKPPTVEATSMAVPAIKGPAPLPPEEKAAE